MSITDWSGDTRRDGVKIATPDGTAYVMCHPDGMSIDACPCCGKPVWTPGGAQRVADYTWPLPTEPTEAAA